MIGIIITNPSRAFCVIKPQSLNRQYETKQEKENKMQFKLHNAFSKKMTTNTINSFVQIRKELTCYTILSVAFLDNI